MRSTTLLLCLGAVFLAANGYAVPKISPELREQLKKSSSVEIIVKMAGGNKAALQNAKASRQMNTLEVRASTVSHFLQIHAQESQASLLAFLSQQEGITFKSFWINNAIFVQNASPELISAISLREDVESVQFNTKVEIVRPTATHKVQTRFQANEWGVSKVQAPEAWAAGYDGTGARIAIIDTGTRGTHKDLAGSYIGDNGWYDAVDGSDAPQDLGGHGTHVMGTIVGANGIGVAPGAKWLSCNAISFWDGTSASVIACGQWVVCPTLPDGTSSPDCNKTPHLVSNSWGFIREWDHEAFYSEVIDAWHAVGIVPIFALGNEGSACETGRFPSGQENVIAVGATDVDNALAYFSSRGPSNFNGTLYLKPDISAPGVNVRSSSSSGDENYEEMSGTSMACPHTAGVAALLFGIKDDLTYDELREILTTQTTLDLQPTGDNCNGTGDEDWPNNSFGYGLVNALKSVNAVRARK